MDVYLASIVTILLMEFLPRTKLLLARHKADKTYIQHTSTSMNDEAFEGYSPVILISLFFCLRNILYRPFILFFLFATMYVMKAP